MGTSNWWAHLTGGHIQLVGTPKLGTPKLRAHPNGGHIQLVGTLKLGTPKLRAHPIGGHTQTMGTPKLGTPELRAHTIGEHIQPVGTPKLGTNIQWALYLCIYVAINNCNIVQEVVVFNQVWYPSTTNLLFAGIALVFYTWGPDRWASTRNRRRTNRNSILD